MTDNQNPPAYPLSFPMGQRMTPGMTLIDHFAGLAMRRFVGDNLTFGEIAEASYKLADAMIKERTKWIK